MNKKAQMGRIVTLIIIVASAIILYLFIAKVVIKTNYDGSINACRLSVLAQSSTELVPTISWAKSPFDVNCDRRYINIYNTKVDIGLSPNKMGSLPVVYGGRKVTRFATLTDSVVNQVIAEEMRICKYQFGDGKIDIFTNNDEIFNDENICFICTEINFDEDVRLEEITTFLEYTKSTSYADGKTYYVYLTETTLEGINEDIENPLFENYEMWNQPYLQGFFDEWKNTVPDIDESDQLYVYVKSYSDTNIYTDKKYAVVVRKSNPAKLNPFSWDNPVTMALLPIDEVNNYCTTQAQ